MFLLVACIVTSPPAFGEPSPESIATRRPNASAEGNRTSQQTVEQAEPPGQSKPDDGPRPEETSQGIDGLAWQEGQAAFRKGTRPEARRFLEKIAKEHPESRLVPSALAYLAEISLKQEASNRTRSDVIQAYKQLVREHPQSQNASRAEWRIADLYLEQGWLQEAQAYYEQVMAHSLHLPFDGNRALLGLGYAFMARRKWNDAEHAFVNLRKRSDHGLLLQRATAGLARALFRQSWLAEAQAFYDLSSRWGPNEFRMDQLALQRYAITLH